MSSEMVWGLSLIMSFLLCPLQFGVINKVKAFFAGRRGPSVLQLYYDMWKLLKKGSVYSLSVGIFFRLGPIVSLAALAVVAMLLPIGFSDSLIAFPGDVILAIYLLGLCRAVTVLAAMETGSSFEGMGASREVYYSALAECVFLAASVFLVVSTGEFSLSGMLNGAAASEWTVRGAAHLLIAASFFIVLLSENCRVPFDDPETHLELTMIHEAMILDYGGPDLSFIFYASALKLWIFASFLVLMIFPCMVFAQWWGGMMLYFFAVFGVSLAIGIIESLMARFRFLKVPQMLIASLALAVVAIILLKL